MLALKGYYNGKEFIALEKAEIKPNQKVIITVLDEFFNFDNKSDKPYKKLVGRLSNESYNEIIEALKDAEKVDKNEW